MTKSTHLLSNDTIVAEATPRGFGGVSVVRISGPLVKTIMAILLQRELQVKKAHYVAFREANNDVIDQGLAIYFAQPNSFTGEDVLELQGHGGPIIVDMLITRILALGARLAEPGEFSLRAFLNGKMDLAQAEAISDLIHASSKQAARLAMRSLQGDFSKKIQELNDSIIHLRMYVEAAIDFTDEEINFLSDHHVVKQLQHLISAVTEITRNAKQGSFLREGISAVIVGKPNVGKSSLLNCLSGKELAIVTDIPGTTRDVLRDYILIDGMPMHIIDTAGLRESEDVVELEGIRRAYQEIEKADLMLYVQDAKETMHDISAMMSAHFVDRPRIIIRNKIDLLHEAPTIKNENGVTIVSLSAKTNVGIDLLRTCIKSSVGFNGASDGIYLARRRHLDALFRAKTFLTSSLQQLINFHSSELAAEDLRLAHLALSEITGEFTADDLLGRIFASFCIGK